MSDLISREFLQTAIHNFFYGLNHTPTEEDIQRYIEVAPSADIIEHARTIKEYCERFPECEGCRFYKELPFRCTLGICPQEWDLPEEKKKSCNTCKNNDDEFSGECYECVKGIENHYMWDLPEGEKGGSDDNT